MHTTSQLLARGGRNGQAKTPGPSTRANRSLGMTTHKSGRRQEPRHMQSYKLLGGAEERLLVCEDEVDHAAAIRLHVDSFLPSLGLAEDGPLNAAFSEHIKG